MLYIGDFVSQKCGEYVGAGVGIATGFKAPLLHHARNEEVNEN